ncbi:MAG: GNAT family N-acetyltransferase [Pseudomonadota bacterium]
MLTSFFGYGDKRNLIVELAQPDDLSQLAGIHAESFERNWSNGDFQVLIAKETNFCFVIRDRKLKKRKILGFALIQQVAYEAEVLTIATSAKNRRKGMGRMLMDAVVRKLQFDRTESLFLDVDETNFAATSLYRKMGFKQVSERKGYYASGSDGEAKHSTALVMRLELR